MFENLIDLFNTNLPRAISTVISLIAILGTLVWISILDIKRKSVTFWKLLISGGLIIVGPLVTSLFCGCRLLPLFIIGSLVLWCVFLFLNIKYNHDKIVGKADIDLVTAPISLLIGYIIWMFKTIDSDIAGVQVSALLYKAFGYFLIGALVFTIIVIISFVIKHFTNKETKLKTLFKKTKVSVIPMLAPFCLVVPYMVMTY